jgi:lipopolysaccharide/colanic/teichoic acid biosynthesis glycosyltransferase
MIKRMFDILVSIIVFIIFIPIAMPIIIILKLTGEGEIFYLQERIGFNGERFNLIKFATMLKNSPNIGSGDITIESDPRVLPAGHFLRKSKLNEVPQILNILKGDMTLVGPRPLTPRNFAFYNDEEQQFIRQMKPGLTGVGSIYFRDEESILSESEMSAEQCYKELIAPYKAKLEKWYFVNQSFKLDLTLCFITAWVIINPKSKIYNKIFKDIPSMNKY